MFRNLLFLIIFILHSSFALANVKEWEKEFPKTNFKKTTISFFEVLSGGPPRDGIPSIDNPVFVSIDNGIGEDEPVIYLEINNEAKIYPMQVLTWHEIVNDTVGGVPVAVTYCPLCNTSVVFQRQLDGQVLDFGTTGKLRKSNLIMYDRQTESWFNQFDGIGIVGDLTGKKLKKIPSLIISYKEAKRIAKQRGYKNKILKGTSFRRYGKNPYNGYDKSSNPFLYQGSLPQGIDPLEYVIVVEEEAYTLQLIQDKKELRLGDIKIKWTAGLNSALETSKISDGRDLGFVRVQKKTKGRYEDIVYDYTFAFVFHAFHNGKQIITKID